MRLELHHTSDRFDARLFYLDTDPDFANPSAQFLRGRREAGLRGRATLTAQTRLFGEAIRTEDIVRGGVRQGAQVGLEHAFDEWLRAELGLRVAHETTAAATDATQGVGEIDVRSIRAKVTSKLPFAPDASVFGEFEQDVATASQRRASLGGDYRLFGRAKLYARHEFMASLAGPYALNPGQQQNNTVFGLAADYMGGQSVFSEYRVRDAISGREAQAAVGLRNLWNVGDGVRVLTSLERVAPVSGDGTTTSAVTAAIEYTASPLWRGSARAEYRSAADGDNLFGSLGYARKISRDLSLLGNTSFSVMSDGGRAFERSRLGIAYRQTDKNTVTALARYEHRYDRNPDVSGDDETKRTAHLVTGHINVQPTTPLTLSAQWASKWATNTSAGLETSNDAHLAGLRVRYDVTDRVDVGTMGRSLFSGDFDAARWGLGAEIGVLIANNLRVAGGYNFFGFFDDELSIDNQTDRGLYLHIGFKFDEALFGRGGNNMPQRAEPMPMLTQAEADSIARVDVAWQRSPLPLHVETIHVRDTLTSPAERITDDVIRDDLAVLDLWATRIDELPADSTPDALYARTRAAELLELATNEYTDNDRSQFPNALVSDVKATVEHLERLDVGQTPTWNDVLDGSTRVAPDAWALVASIKADSARFACIASDIARLEAALLWAGNEELTCSDDDPRPLLQRALALADSVQLSADACATQPQPVEPPVEPEPETVPAAQPQPDVVAEPQQPAEPEVTVVHTVSVPNVVHFAFDRADVQGLSIAVLDSVAHVLHLFPDVRIELVGHTDTRGDHQYNLALGERRARSVYQLLMDLGVSSDRMDIRSDGETNRFMRIARSDRDHALNRRVEIRFVASESEPLQPRRQERDIKPWLLALSIDVQDGATRSRYTTWADLWYQHPIARETRSRHGDKEGRAHRGLGSPSVPRLTYPRATV
jgi:outer membrane protein OmpA-like peptidoglycan-associated protein